MATKENPGRYDCYANAEPKEEYFVLLARDRRAPYLVELWAAASRVSVLGMLVAFARLVAHAMTRRSSDPDKVDEAEGCARRMRAWRAMYRP